jgi:hypothetical protein
MLPHRQAINDKRSSPTSPPTMDRSSELSILKQCSFIGNLSVGVGKARWYCL